MWVEPWKSSISTMYSPYIIAIWLLYFYNIELDFDDDLICEFGCQQNESK